MHQWAARHGIKRGTKSVSMSSMLVLDCANIRMVCGFVHSTLELTVRLREIGTQSVGTILEFASVPPKINRTLAWVLPTLSVCPTSMLTHLKSRPNLELASGNCES